MTKDFFNKFFKTKKKVRLLDHKQDVLTIFMKDQIKKILRFGEMPISLYTK